VTPPRFFVRRGAIQDGQVRFEGAEAHHLARVRRLRPGDVVEATDGAGAQYRVRLDALGPREARGTVLGPAPGRPESPLAVTLAAALLRGERMAWLVQKATELGVARIWPMVTARAVARPPAGARDQPPARWVRVAREATKQCGRGVAPVVEPVASLAAVLARAAEHDAAWLFWEGAGAAPLVAPAGGARPPERVLLVVGPEGGFTPAEVEEARAAGVPATALGPRVLRAESAALAALAVVQFLFGDLGPRDARVPGSAAGPRP
jgi:16S rRNA (uracil1498-N3)-methyltransferase